MKHQVPESMKFRKLQRRLGTSRLVTVGTLELLWLSTQKNCPQGDIGKFTDEEIAIECEWEGNADELVEALAATGWLDRDPEHRLIVHDWEEHAPGWIKRQLKRHGKSFVTPSSRPSVTDDCLEATVVSPIVTRDAQEATRNLTQPNPTQSNPTKPNGDASASCPVTASPTTGLDEAPPAVADRICLEYPTVLGSTNGPTAWQLRASLVAEFRELFPALDIEAQCRSALAWVRADEGRRKTAKGMRKFLTGWLERAQNRGDGRSQRGSPVATHDPRNAVGVNAEVKQLIRSGALAAYADPPTSRGES